jgi:predicted transposase/invertase (TIGR01784 family)
MSAKMKQSRQLEKSKNSQYDSAWKDVIEELLESFLKFFFPDVHKDIDFSKKIEFLSKELRKIAPDGTVGQRYADELIKVHIKDGSAKYLRIFIHLEIQGKQEANLQERVFIYFYRIFDRHREEGTEVVSLVVLTDENKNYRPNEYRTSRWGFDLRMKFPLAKIIDYKHKKKLREELAKSDNPMAMVVKAQLRSYELREADNNKKSSVKWQLIRQCYEKGYSKIEITTLFKFFDWIIRLPDDYENQLTEKIIKLEEENKMPYVTSWERIAEKRGEEIGKKRGEKKGEKKGMKKEKLETARRMLNENFPIETIIKCTELTEEEIKAIMN